MARKKVRRRGPKDGHDANNTEYMNCDGADAALPTCDPSDRAHNMRDESGFLVPTRRLPKGLGKPRRYHPSYMVVVAGGWVSFETAFEESEARRLWLEHMELLPPVESLGLATRAAMALQESQR